LYNPITKKVITSRDVIFDEENFWTWEEDISQQQIPVDFDAENEKVQTLVNEQHADNEQQQPNSQIDESVDERPQRVKRRPT